MNVNDLLRYFITEKQRGLQNGNILWIHYQFDFFMINTLFVKTEFVSKNTIVNNNYNPYTLPSKFMAHKWNCVASCGVENNKCGYGEKSFTS